MQQLWSRALECESELKSDDESDEIGSISSSYSIASSSFSRLSLSSQHSNRSSVSVESSYLSGINSNDKNVSLICLDLDETLICTELDPTLIVNDANKSHLLKKLECTVVDNVDSPFYGMVIFFRPHLFRFLQSLIALKKKFRQKLKIIITTASSDAYAQTCIQQIIAFANDKHKINCNHLFNNIYARQFWTDDDPQNLHFSKSIQMIKAKEKIEHSYQIIIIDDKLSTWQKEDRSECRIIHIPPFNPIHPLPDCDANPTSAVSASAARDRCLSIVSSILRRLCTDQFNFWENSVALWNRHTSALLRKYPQLLNEILFGNNGKPIFRKESWLRGFRMSSISTQYSVYACLNLLIATSKSDRNRLESVYQSIHTYYGAFLLYFQFLFSDAKIRDLGTFIRLYKPLKNGNNVPSARLVQSIVSLSLQSSLWRCHQNAFHSFAMVSFTVPPTAQTCPPLGDTPLFDAFQSTFLKKVRRQSYSNSRKQITFTHKSLSIAIDNNNSKETNDSQSYQRNRRQSLQ